MIEGWEESEKREGGKEGGGREEKGGREKRGEKVMSETSNNVVKLVLHGKL